MLLLLNLLALVPVAVVSVTASPVAAAEPTRQQVPAGKTSPQATSSEPSPQPGIVQLEAREQRREGPVLYADGDVDIRYGDTRVRADHVEYNTATYEIVARGHVQYDHDNQHLDADQADYNVRSGHGRFEHVTGSVRIEREANAAVLATPNPLSFVADSVERVDETTYRVFRARVTVCDPRRPNWTFNAAEATLRVNRKLLLLHANFRLFRIPLFYTPYASLPAGRRLRQSGFLMPEIGHSSIKGYVLGDSYYWAPSDWMDATLGAQLLSRRGWSQTGDLRLLPWENVRISANYFGVVDRLGQGGHSLSFKLDAQLAHGWHASVDLNQLTSLTFQEAFSPTFSEAVNSEVHTTAFLTNNFRGFSVNLAANNYKDFLTPETITSQGIVQPGTAIVLRTTPEVRLGSVDQAPGKRWPFYFGFDVLTDGVHRSDPGAVTAQGVTLAPPTNTHALVDRSEFAPRVTLPLHWGPWLGVTPTYTFSTMRYGDQVTNGAVAGVPLWRNAGELSVDLRPAAFERVWQTRGSKWKHTIEPAIVYNYVTGVNDFSRFIRIDQDDTITDTNEIEYSVTQRLFRRKAAGTSEEFASWTLLQKYYFDPTFGGAIVPGQRNVFQALDSVTPFAFADGTRRFSPLVSDIKISPGGPYDAEFRIDYDPVRGRITTAESLLKMHPHGKLELTVAQYSIDATSVLQPLSSQIRTLIGYGDLNQRGWSGSMGFSYDIRQGIAQNELAQVSYNSSCCGLAFGFQRLALGSIRTENQFRVALIIANIGTFGNLRRQDKIF
jgi:LPS-assembly protein